MKINVNDVEVMEKLEEESVVEKNSRNTKKIKKMRSAPKDKKK